MAGALTRWDPFAELGELRSRFDRAFDELTGGHDLEHDTGTTASCRRSTVRGAPLK